MKIDRFGSKNNILKEKYKKQCLKISTKSKFKNQH